MAIERVTILVADGLGVGEAPDAGDYGDGGSDTLGNIARRIGGFSGARALPTLGRLGLGNIHAAEGVDSVAAPLASFGKMAAASAGKDTTTGHWEMAGLVVTEPFATFPGGFPGELVSAFERAIGRRTLGNRVASGTVIIEELGGEHVRTGSPILYTSADSVFQLAAHEEVIPVPELYRICEAARRLCDAYRIGRIIARPFVGKPGAWKRTYNRKDFSMPPLGPTVLTRATAKGLPVVGIGKIENIFAGAGITTSIHTEGNVDGLKKTVETLASTPAGVIFTNLVDFDMLYGHRNDAVGFARALREFDERLPDLLAALTPRDMLLITGDHGCDPTDVSTDHTREYVPLICYAPALKSGVDLGARGTMSDMAATIAEALDLGGKRAPTAGGGSFYKEIAQT